MKYLPREMPQKYQKLYSEVLDVLCQQGCVIDYSIVNHEVDVHWTPTGFDKAFSELKTNAKPFGMTKKNQRATLLLVLAKEDKEQVDKWIIEGFKARYGL